MIATLALFLAMSGAPAQPATFESLSQAAAQARVEQRDDDAIRLYRDAVARQPDWKEGLWYLGMLQYRKNRHSEACQTLRRFLAEDPNPGQGWVVLGLSEFATRDYSRALQHLERGMAGSFEDKELAKVGFYHTAILHTRMGNFGKSLDLYFTMQRSGFSGPSLWEGAGLAALHSPLLPAEIPLERREMFRLAGQGTLAMMNQQHGEAEEYLSALVKAFPAEPEVHYLLGRLLMDIRPEDGVPEMRRELEIWPNNVSALMRLSEYYLKQEQPELALPLSRDAVRRSPKTSTAHMFLGEALAAQQDFVEAIRELETARELTPEVGRVHVDLLRAYKAVGRNADAERERAAIKALDQGNTSP